MTSPFNWLVLHVETQLMLCGKCFKISLTAVDFPSSTASRRSSPTWHYEETFKSQSLLILNEENHSFFTVHLRCLAIVEDLRLSRRAFVQSSLSLSSDELIMKQCLYSLVRHL